MPGEPPGEREACRFNFRRLWAGSSQAIVSPKGVGDLVSDVAVNPLATHALVEDDDPVGLILEARFTDPSGQRQSQGRPPDGCEVTLLEREGAYVRRQPRDRVVERNASKLSGNASKQLERVIRQEDRFGVTSRYLAAIGDPDYESAFAKLVMESGEPVRVA